MSRIVSRFNKDAVMSETLVDRRQVSRFFNAELTFYECRVTVRLR